MERGGGGEGDDEGGWERGKEGAGGAVGAGKPVVIRGDTGKGKGVGLMENSVLWHYRTARGEEYGAARNELKAGKP